MFCFGVATARLRVAAVKQYAVYVIENSCSAKVLVDFLNDILLALITNDK